MKIKIKKLFYLLVSVSISTKICFATTLINTHNAQLFKARGSLSAFMRKAQLDQIEAESMYPLISRENALWYWSVQGQYADPSWRLGVGTGYRELVNAHRFVGGYLFIDRMLSPQNQSYWMMTPGLETMSHQWGFRVTAYLPIGLMRKNLEMKWGHQLGIQQDHYFTAHKEYDVKYRHIEQISPGLDMQISWMPSKLPGLIFKLGGYYFDHQSVFGITSSLEKALNQHINLSLKSSYDAIRGHRLLAGLKLNLGGNGSKAVTTQKHFLAPIERYLAPSSASFNTSYFQNPQQPVALTRKQRESPVELHKSQALDTLVRDNIYFYSPAGYDEDGSLNEAVCSFEKPCGPAALNSQNLQKIQENAQEGRGNPIIYLAAGGQYGDPEAYHKGQPLTVSQGLSLMGRTENFQAAVTHDKTVLRPFILGSLNLESNTAVSGIHLRNVSHSHDRGLNIKNAQNVSVNNMYIGGPEKGDGYRNAVNIANSQQVEVGSSFIESNELYHRDWPLTGILLRDSQHVTIHHSHLMMKNNQKTARGLYVDTQRSRTQNVDFNHNIVELSGSGELMGLYISDQSAVSATHNNFRLHGFWNAIVYGSFTRGTGHLIADHNHFDLKAKTVIGMGMGGEASLVARDNIFEMIAYPRITADSPRGPAIIALNVQDGHHRKLEFHRNIINAKIQDTVPVSLSSHSTQMTGISFLNGGILNATHNQFSFAIETPRPQQFVQLRDIWVTANTEKFNLNHFHGQSNTFKYNVIGGTDAIPQTYSSYAKLNRFAARPNS